jgi:chromosome segregation ATPase
MFFLKKKALVSLEDRLKDAVVSLTSEAEGLSQEINHAFGAFTLASRQLESASTRYQQKIDLIESTKAELESLKEGLAAKRDYADKVRARIDNILQP